MKELVVISGKGGTGKTSITAGFATLSHSAVLADCDVDAADLHLVLAPRKLMFGVFTSGNEAVIRQDDCTDCGLCRTLCRFDAIIADTEGHCKINQFACEGCGVCVRFCPAQAVDFPERECGEWFVSDTRCGPMVHARLGIAAENSGKLVSLVRKEARRIAEEQDAGLILVDGPPGIGCPVIASVTGADCVAAVTEPSLSGKHDLERLLKLTGHFKVPAMVIVNKWDINPRLTEEIEQSAADAGATMLGRVSYDKQVTAAQIAGKSVVEFNSGTAAQEIRDIWDKLLAAL
jgi:MinD superfamily P-loop ATPase